MRGLARLLGFVGAYRALVLASLATLAVNVCLDLALPRLVQRVVDDGVLGKDRAVLYQTAVVMISISAVSTLVALANNAASVRVGEGVARDLRLALFRKIMSLSSGNLDRLRTGSLLVRLTSDVAQIRVLTQISLRIGTRAPLMMAGSVALMFGTSPALATVMVPVLLVTAALVVFFVLRTEPRLRAVQEELDVLNATLQENVAGARIVKAFVRREEECARFDAVNARMTGRSIRAIQFMSTMTPVLTMCVNVGVVVVVWSGGAAVVDGRLSTGQLVAFTNYMLSTMAPLVLMTLLSSTWAAGLASARRAAEVLDTPPDVVDDAGARRVPLGSRLPGDGAVDVLFEDAGVTYADGAEAALEGVDLRVTTGETVAILGATGAGKSTLANLVPRFYDVTRGRVSVAGSDVREVSRRSLLDLVVVVPQETTLFSGTVKDNIRYGRPEATDHEVRAAAVAADADGFVSSMPGGYDARLTRKGTNLSGGQRQRIAIARALLLQPRVLVLDDATSAIDTATEARIHEALRAGAGARLTLLVAQRISAARTADTIVVLDRGRVVARGTHTELLRSSEVYREIHASQLGAPGEDATDEIGGAP